MAAQLAVLLGGRLGVPVRMREVDAVRAAAGRDRVRDLVEREARRGRMGQEDAGRLLGAITVGTDLSDLAGADLVVEAVTEVLDVKRAVFAELEDVVGPDAVLATNTSALSVTAMAEGLRRPERVVGMHFFNPVAQMPLVEVVRAVGTSDAALATAFAVAREAGKTAVLVADRPGFVVNRLLLRELADVLHAVETGTPVEVADAALRPLGLPMGPFALLQLVGLPVALHVLEHLHEDFGERFPLSPGLAGLAADGRAGGARAGRHRPRGGRRPGDPGRLRRAGRAERADVQRCARLGARRPGAGGRPHARRGRRGLARADRPRDDPRRRVPVPPRRAAAVPGPDRSVGAGARSSAPARAQLPAQAMTRPLARSWDRTRSMSSCVGLLA